MAARQFHAVPEKTVRDNRAGRADRFVAEQNRLLRRQRADAVMVNDFDDLHLVRALHRLRKFVVIHQNQFARDGFQKVGLGQDADRPSFLIQHRKGEITGRHGLLAHGGQRRVFAETQKFLVQHVPHGHGRAAERGGRGGVVRRGDDADLVFLRGLDGLRFHRHAAGHDQHAHALADGDVLDVSAVADEHAAVFPAEIFPAARRRIPAPSRRSSGSIPLRVPASKPSTNLPPSVARGCSARTGLRANCASPVHRRKKEFAQLEQAKAARGIFAPRPAPAACGGFFRPSTAALPRPSSPAARSGFFAASRPRPLGETSATNFGAGTPKVFSTKSMRSFVSPQRAATASAMPVRRLNSA